jgi:hypothetical protein
MLSMELREMFIDENNIKLGVNAVSVVEDPAIESNFITLKEDNKIELAEVSKERRILLGAALIPNKPILRIEDEKEYYIFFSKETIAKVALMFAKNKYSDQVTEEHEKPVKGMTIFESWLTEDKEKDKSAFYGLDVPVGTWCISMKADNDDIYNLAKQGKIKGFSIEGYFSDKVEKKELSKEDEEVEILRKIMELL